ncbi:MAG: efflux RND transporter periplasmic adaptor subunit [Ignavibacteriaceae bacterium]
MKISRKIIFLVFGFVLLIILIYALIPVEENKEKELNSNINYNKLDEVVFNVRTKEVIKGDLIKSISANGLIKAYRELDMVSNITGYIDEIYIYEGKSVNSGDTLLKFDDRDYKIAISEAEVNLMNAKIEYGFFRKEESQNININLADSLRKEISSLEKLFSERKINEEEYLNKKDQLDLALLFSGAKRDEVLLNKSGMTNAQNSINRARLNLSYTKIIAPFSGIIGDFEMVPRTRINAGEKIFKLIDISRLKVEVGILENEITSINVGSKAEVKLNAIPGKIYSGHVIYINPLIDPETKTCRVTVEIPNSDRNIKPGMFASINIESEILSDRILIPKEALLIRDKRNLVFITENNLAKWHYVQIGSQNDKYIEILDGVLPGDKVIVEGHYNLAHDSNIKAIKE